MQLNVTGNNGAVKYDTYAEHVSGQSAKNTVYDRAWKTTTVNSTAQAESGFTAQANIANLNSSDLTINATAVGYIVWDCGSASDNV